MAFEATHDEVPIHLQSELYAIQSEFEVIEVAAVQSLALHLPDPDSPSKQVLSEELVKVWQMVAWSVTV